MRKQGAAQRGWLMEIYRQVLLTALLGVGSWGVKYVAKIPMEISELRQTMELIVEKLKDHDKRIDRLEGYSFQHP